jgi:hypothetical protein
MGGPSTLFEVFWISFFLVSPQGHESFILTFFLVHRASQFYPSLFVLVVIVIVNYVYYQIIVSPISLLQILPFPQIQIVTLHFFYNLLLLLLLQPHFLLRPSRTHYDSSYNLTAFTKLQDCNSVFYTGYTSPSSTNTTIEATSFICLVCPFMVESSLISEESFLPVLSLTPGSETLYTRIERKDIYWTT